MSTIALSGGFDPLHVGHLDMIHAARKYGDVIIILNTDEWLKRKKHHVFMPHTERAEILLGLEAVSDVVTADDEDGTVRKTLVKLRPDYFGNGGDRQSDNTPEDWICNELGIEPVYNLGGSKRQSSSHLSGYIRRHHWGGYRTLASGDSWNVKLLYFNEDGAIREQRHARRNEYWKILEGYIKLEREGLEPCYMEAPKHQTTAIIRADQWHKATAIKPSVVLECWIGDSSEDDIEVRA